MNWKRQSQKLRSFTDFTHSLASHSTCKRASVGAIVVDMDLTVVRAIGYNGQPRLLPNDGCTGVKGMCGCVHAEANAICKLGDKGRLMICTTAPCTRCAGLIINSGIIEAVLYKNLYRDEVGLSNLKTANIRTCKWSYLDANFSEWWDFIRAWRQDAPGTPEL